MCPCADVFDDDAFEVATCDPSEVEEHVVAVARQVLGDRQRPRNVGTAIAEKHGFLNTTHISERDIRQNEVEDTKKPYTFHPQEDGKV